jgi:hypothetical protein
MTEEKIDNGASGKSLKLFVHLKYCNRVKGPPTEWEKYLQLLYLVKGYIYNI